MASVGKPEYQQKLSRQAEVRPRLKRVMLVLEGGEESQWIFAELSRWLPPEEVEINLVQAVEELADSDWFIRDSRNYMESLIVRQNQLQDSMRRCSDWLARENYKVVQSSINVTSSEGAHRLLEDLGRTGADMLMIVSPLNPPERHWVSGFAMSLTTHAATPALLLRKPSGAGSHTLRVLFATDETEASAVAARKLPGLLPPGNLDVNLVTVQNPYYLENAMLAPYVNMAAIDEAFEENARLILNIARDLLEAGGVRVSHSYRVIGSPGWTLLDAIEKDHPDLVVAGSHNRQGLSRLLGSVSHRLVQSDNHNILIIR